MLKKSVQQTRGLPGLVQADEITINGKQNGNRPSRVSLKGPTMPPTTPQTLSGTQPSHSAFLSIVQHMVNVVCEYTCVHLCVGDAAKKECSFTIRTLQCFVAGDCRNACKNEPSQQKVIITDY